MYASHMCAVFTADITLDCNECRVETVVTFPDQVSRTTTDKPKISSSLTSLPKVIWEQDRVAAKVSPHWYNGGPQIRSQKYPFPWSDPQTPLRASSLDPYDL